jgi:hypothetical protein
MAATPSGTEFYRVVGIGYTSYLTRYDTFGNQLASAQILDSFGSAVRVEALVVDTDGNAIIAYRVATEQSGDVQISKYSPSLTRTWTYRRSTPNEPDQMFVRMTLDDSNNIYFGNSILISNQTDVRITKLSSTGTFQWDYLFNAGPSDTINVLKHNPDVNKVYYGGGTGAYPYVSALTESGLFGGQRVEGLGAQNPSNWTSDIAILDAASNSDVVMYGNFDSGPRFVRRLNEGLFASVAYVTGTSTRAAKIVRSGNFLFTSGWSGGNSVVERRDVAALAATHTANVTGSSSMLALSNNGNSLFIDGANAGQVNSMLGQVLSTTDLANQGSYSANGSRSFGGAIPVGPARFVIASNTGESADINTYLDLVDSSLSQIWQFGETYEAPVRRETLDGAVDSQNNYYAVSQVDGITRRLELVKYDSAGVLQWAMEVPGGDNSDASIAIGADDNPVVARSNNQQTAVLVTKLNGQGGTVWSRSFTGETDGKIRLAIGADGTLAMAASYYFTVGGRDSVVWKLNPTTGAQIWRRIYDFSEKEEFVQGLQVAPSGYIMTAGITNDRLRGYTLVYAPNGDLHWQFDQTITTGTFVKSSLSMQSSGLGATVHMYNDGANVHRFSLVRFDPVRRLTLFTGNLVGNANEPSFESATSPAGTVYIAQANPLSKGLIQYNSNGTIAWVRTLPSGVTSVQKVITDAQNSVYVLARETLVDSTGAEIQGWYLVKYNTLGTFVSQRRIQAGASMDALPTTIAMGKVFDLWLMGSVQTLNTSQNLSVVRYAQPVAPTVAGETYTVAAGQTLTVNAPGVLANDLDLNGDPISASIVSNPSVGTLTLNANGSLTYLAPATAGTRTFTYRVSDTTGRSTNAVCTINVN